MAGGRCTDGCWISLRVWRHPETGADTLLVLLDAEGELERLTALLELLPACLPSHILLDAEGELAGWIADTQ